MRSIMILLIYQTSQSEIFEISSKKNFAHLGTYPKSGLFNHFRLPRDKFLSYFHALEQGYKPVAYHNSMHAADVLQSVWCLINSIPAGDTK